MLTIMSDQLLTVLTNLLKMQLLKVQFGPPMKHAQRGKRDEAPRKTYR